MKKSEKYLRDSAMAAEVLKSNRCIESYMIENGEPALVWTERGFEIAFNEFKANPQHPFGIKTKAAAVHFYMLLVQKDKKTMDDFVIGNILGQVNGGQVSN